MKKQIIEPLKKINSQQVNIFKELAQINFETLKIKLSENEWSVIEILQHLYLIELVSLKYIQKKLQFVDYLPKRKLVSLLRYSIMKAVSSTPAKFKAPKFKILAKFHSLEEAQVKWVQLRADLEHTLERIPNSVADGLLWKHALVGKMSIYHMILFFHDHSERHKKQIERVLKVVNENASQKSILNKV